MSDMHPCPQCHSDNLTVFVSEHGQWEVRIIHYEGAPAMFDYEIVNRDPQSVEYHRVRCDDCQHAFDFDLETYQEANENPYEHDSSYSGCREGCEACAWEEEHSV